MDLIRQAIEALEPFARDCEEWNNSASLEDRVTPGFIELARAAEALAALRKLDAEIEQGFEEWWSEHAIDFVDAHVSAASYLANREAARAAYRAGQLARIPKDQAERCQGFYPVSLDERKAVEAAVEEAVAKHSEIETEDRIDEFREFMYGYFIGLRRGQLARIPTEIREALVDGMYDAETLAFQEAEEYDQWQRPAKADAERRSCERYAKARAWLEGK